MSRGPNVFAVARSIWDHDMFAPEPFSEREAWIWLIGAAAWKDTKVRINGTPVAVARGEFCFAVRFMAEKFQWSKSRTDRFIHRLEKQDIIRDTSRDNAKIYSINKYNNFQVVGLPKRDTDQDAERDLNGTSPGLDRDKEETVKQVNIETVEERDAPKGAVVLFKPKPPTVVESIPPWVNPSAWAAYCELRRRKRAPMTDHALGLIFGKLDEWRAKGHDPTEVLNNSIQNGWTGIFEPKDNESGGRSGTKNNNFLTGVHAAIADFAEGKP